MVDAKASKAFVQAEHESSSLSPCNKANAQLQKKSFACTFGAVLPYYVGEASSQSEEYCQLCQQYCTKGAGPALAVTL